MNDPVASQQALEAGLRHLTHERIGPALVSLAEAVSADPADPVARAFLAAALFADRRPDEAEAAIRQSLALDPDGYWPRLKSGELRFRLGDIDAAEGDFLVALRAVEPGTRESEVAAASLVRVRAAKSKAVSHHAVLPGGLGRFLRRGPAPLQPSTVEARGGAP